MGIFDSIFGATAPKISDPGQLVSQEEKLNRPDIFSAFGGRTIGTGEGGRATVTLDESPENRQLREAQQSRALGFFSGAGGDFGREATEKALFDRSFSLAQPERERSRRDLETSLSLKGLPIGSEAFQGAQERLETQQSEQLRQLALQSVLAGGAESRAERGQQFSEISPALQSQAQSQQFLQGLSDVQPVNVSGIFQQADLLNLQKTKLDNEMRESRRKAISDLIIGSGNVAGGGAPGAGSAGAGGAGAAPPPVPPSDKRLKNSIKQIGISESGINIYQFRYDDVAKSLFGLDNKTLYQGVIAQEIKDSNPDAIVMNNGYMTVDYSKIDVEFKEV